MSDYPFTLEDVVAWISSLEDRFNEFRIDLAEIKQRSEFLPGAAADFDSADATGRINVWISGEFDFEVLDQSSGRDILFRHVNTRSLNDRALESAIDEFTRAMIGSKMSPELENADQPL